MIRLLDIYKSYYTEYTSVEVLKGIDLHISEGEFVSIMGTSGSGKSTLLNIIGILDEYDAGEYYLSGTLMKDLSEKQAAYYRNQFIGFVLDRKSTRLNSSHVAISYAVFCLTNSDISSNPRHC